MEERIIISKKESDRIYYLRNWQTKRKTTAKLDEGITKLEDSQKSKEKK